MASVFITHHFVVSPLGYGSLSNFDQLKLNHIGIKSHKAIDASDFVAAMVDREMIDKRFERLVENEHHTFLEKMMILAIDEVITSSGLKITDKTGLLVATTKGNIDLLASSGQESGVQKRVYLHELANHVASFFRFSNKPVVLSNACVSGVLALGVAQRSINAGLYDDMIVVSGDIVSEFVLKGFNSFQAISPEPCKPYSKFRDGISIGEAVSCVVVTADKAKASADSVEVLSCGSANDANHISGPSRTGEGLYLSVKAAMHAANFGTADLDYISAHGTATVYNDEMESIAFERLGLSEVPLNSLKGYFGHTLGSAGLLESIMGILSMNQNVLIASGGFDQIGVSGKINIVKENIKTPLNSFLKTASGFGGCNTAVIFRTI